MEVRKYKTEEKFPSLKYMNVLIEYAQRLPIRVPENTIIPRYTIVKL